MKKFLIGCLSVGVLVLGVGGFFAYRFLAPYIRGVTGIADSAKRLEQVSTLNKQVSNTFSFVAPEDGVLSEEQVQRYVVVQNTMKTRLGQRISEFDAKYKKLEEDDVNLGNAAQVLGAYQDILKLVLEAKQVQVEALNEQGFSLNEYAWVKREALRAAFLPLTGLDLSQFGDISADLPALSESIPEANTKLLEPYKENLEELIGLAFFGL